MSSRRLEDLRPEFQPRALRVIERANREIALSTGRPISVVVSMTLRPRAEQAILYAKGRSTLGRLCNKTVCPHCGDGGLGHTVTNARPGWSWHEHGLAFDVLLLESGKVTEATDEISDAAWLAFGKIVDSEGLCWGGHWGIRDGPHVELHINGLGCRDAGKVKPTEIA